MRLKVAEQIDAARRTRQLASRERVGRYARGVLWTQIKSFIRRYWVFLLFLLVLPLAISLVLSLRMKGPERWIFIGAFGGSGPWLVAIFVILWGGVATTYMGIDGENSTADVLRQFQSRGWILVNGLKFKEQADIDHILIGPGGLLVFETKWSRERWPTVGSKENFMSGRLNKAISQANWNRRDVERQFKDILEGVAVHAVCVLWSSEDSSEDLPWFEREGVSVVRGPALESWLSNYSGISLDQQGIKRVSEGIQSHALGWDEREFSDSGAPPRTLTKFFVQTVLEPFVGFYLVASGLIAATHVRTIWIYVGPVLCLIVGWLASRDLRFRRAAYGWLAGTAAFTISILAVEIRFLFR